MALRMPHRPLAAATLQCIASAALKPYPSVADVAQYLVSRLFCLEACDPTLYVADACAAVGCCRQTWCNRSSGQAALQYCMPSCFGQLTLLSAAVTSADQWLPDMWRSRLQDPPLR